MALNIPPRLQIDDLKALKEPALYKLALDTRNWINQQLIEISYWVLKYEPGRVNELFLEQSVEIRSKGTNMITTWIPRLMDIEKELAHRKENS